MIRYLLFVAGICALIMLGIMTHARQNPVEDSMTLAVYEADDQGNQILSRVDFTGQQVILMQSDDLHPMISFEWSNDGEWVLVTTKHRYALQGDVYLVHRSGRVSRHIYQVPKIVSGAHFSPDNQSIALIAQDNAQGYLMHIDMNGKLLAQIDMSPATNFSQTWRFSWLDHDTLQFVTGTTYEVFTLDLTTESFEPSEDIIQRIAGYGVSPDGQWSLQTTYSTKPVINLAKRSMLNSESEPILVADVEAFTLQDMYWSDDSQWLIVKAIAPTVIELVYPEPGQLYVINMSTHEIQPLLDVSFYKFALPFYSNQYTLYMQHKTEVFSPNNQWVVLAKTDDAGKYQIYRGARQGVDVDLFVVRTDGSNQIIDKLVSGRILDAHLAWAPYLPLNWHPIYLLGLGMLLLVLLGVIQFTKLSG